MRPVCLVCKQVAATVQAMKLQETQKNGKWWWKTSYRLTGNETSRETEMSRDAKRWKVVVLSRRSDEEVGGATKTRQLEIEVY